MALTKNDFRQIRVVLKEELDKQEQKFEDKVTQLKSDFFEKVDPIFLLLN